MKLTIDRLALWILFVLLFAMAVRVPLDTDVWWHLRSAEWMVDNGKILDEDIFSHTQTGEAWINHSWGGELLLYGAYRLTGGGVDPAGTGSIGLALLTGTLATLGMAGIYRMCAGNVYSRMFVMVIGASTAAVFWTPRPQMFSFVLGVATLYLLYLYKYQQRDRLWLIPPLMVVWVNLHAGFAIGFIILFGFIAGEIISRLLNPAEALTWAQLRKVGIVTGVGIVALSINPFGPQMILYPFRTAGLQALNLFIVEWKSPDFKIPATWPFIFLLGAIVVLGSRAPKLPWSDLVLTAGTAALALWSARNIAVFAIVATPVLSRQLDGWLTAQGWQIQPSRTLTPVQARLNLALAVMVLVAAGIKIGAELTPSAVQEAHEEFLPVELATYLNEHHPQGPMFNEYNWGGYLIFTVPDLPVYVDGRTDLYGDDFLRDYIRAILGAKEWQTPLAGINLVVVQKQSALTTLLRQDSTTWELAYEDDLAVVFERR